MTIRHVLLDADGVLQSVPGGWLAAVEQFVGDGAIEFLEQTWAEELPALRGEGDFLAEFTRAVERRGLDVDAAEFYRAVWNAIEVAPESVDLVHQLRAGGYGVHLGTNQERHRAAYMRTVLGYDDLFDVSCYSCDLGAVKPERAYFERALDQIGVPAAQVLFIDDNVANVEGARAAGLAAEHWELTRGLPELWSLLAGHGVEPGR
ncbi:HAD family hydrolase [Nocardioides sp. T2.26MG-1]|uniref:HAD family hydrolase n=1 Tax=Nocardioides sp. T2.26MG-1 TaxID=3041166 RepID=UPI00247786ED|nr:HAD family phosphatase [Nocardioides sp. T2.26MG-1]CAI9398818.1 Phosphoglycolate phosphatase [Nocardioides sp. T2.26MG-1]